eukprot:TRINITY_DN12870_c2_g1_i1.p2 TRINITY_DN12870_c2_g1~~TRINITY_DN12870_c2_g1_i1.p2  ORF type:complete len:129 (-),score=3.56 TRINITY_DN12870_c2_g1_i1:22-408(-)
MPSHPKSGHCSDQLRKNLQTKKQTILYLRRFHKESSVKNETIQYSTCLGAPNFGSHVMRNLLSVSETRTNKIKSNFQHSFVILFSKISQNLNNFRQIYNKNLETLFGNTTIFGNFKFSSQEDYVANKI